MRKYSIIVAAVAGLVASRAFADVSASASASNFRYEVSDLDPNDGIAATLSFSSLPLYNSSVGAVATLDGTQTSERRVGSSSYGDAVANAANAQAAAVGRVVGDGTLGGAALLAEGHATRAAKEADFASTATLLRPSLPSDPPFASFTLSANSMVHFMMDATVFAAATSFQETVLASAYIDIFDADGVERVSRLSTDLLSTGSVSYSGVVEVFLGNFTGASKSYYADVGVNAVGGVLAVPEPATYALMAAGLGFVGWASRRRLRQAWVRPTAKR